MSTSDLERLEKQKAWSEEPATERQLIALRRLAEKTGRTFSVGITRGMAWRRICQATKLIRDPLRSECEPPR